MRLEIVNPARQPVGQDSPRQRRCEEQRGVPQGCELAVVDAVAHVVDVPAAILASGQPRACAVLGTSAWQRRAHVRSGSRRDGAE